MTAPETTSSPFSADCSRNADDVCLRVSGRLVNLGRVMPDWSDCLNRLAGATVRVDLGAVTEMDARGLGMLAELTRQTRLHGGRIAVVRASARVKRLLALTHLDALLEEPNARGPRAAA